MKSIWKFLNILTLILLAAFLGLRDVLPVSADAPFQTITILTHAPSTAADGESFTVDAVADSGLTVTYSASGVCTNVGATFTMTSSIGTCFVYYDQAGDTNYDPAPQETEQVTAQAAATATATATPTPTETETPTHTPTQTVGASATPTQTESPTETITPTSSPSNTATPTQTIPPAAQEFYVSTSGNDTNTCTSSAEPCLTINGALSKTNVGDTIKVAGGTYTGTGTEVVLIDKAIIITGGWNDTFDTQNGTSIIDGQQGRRVITITNTNDSVAIDHFTIQNGGYNIATGIYNLGHATISNSTIKNNKSSGSGGGVYNLGILTIDLSTIENNTASNSGGGIYNSGTLTLTNSIINKNNAYQSGGGVINQLGTITIQKTTISNNSVTGGSTGGGGLYNYLSSTAIITNSSIYNNVTTYSDGGGVDNDGTMTIISSTITNNTARSRGGGLHNEGMLTLNNVTIIGNVGRESGGGIHRENGTVMIGNSLVANNTATANGPNCAGTINSTGYNLLNSATGCSFIGTSGDIINTNLNIGPSLIGSPAFYPLLANSPAVNGGNPTMPGTGGNSCAPTDQRGLARVGRCDIGAFEYTTPGTVVSLEILDGTPQTVGPFLPFAKLMKVIALDSQSNPVPGVTISFAAPASGASGTFADSHTNTTAINTNANGIAISPIFTANNVLGAYSVFATTSEVSTPSIFMLTNFTWYVTASGNDNNDCITSVTACASINGALGKATSGDTISVTSGIYTYGSSSIGNQVILLNKDATISGGWNTAFSKQDGITIIDGGGTRRGLTVMYGAVASIDRFFIRHSKFSGIYVDNSTLTVSNSLIRDNNSVGISNNGYITINATTIVNNTNNYNCAGGIETSREAIINNSTISDNASIYKFCGAAGGILVALGKATINNSTITRNYALSGGGIIISHAVGYEDPIVTITNTIIAGNTSKDANVDCLGKITSLGYSLIGNKTGCTFIAQKANIFNVDAKLGQLIGIPGYTPLLAGSPAINKGDSTTCLATDQRNLVRPQGGICDIGAYEYKLPGVAAFIDYLTPQNQSKPVGASYLPFSVYAVDLLGSPVPGVKVVLSSPSSGPSGTFANTNTRTSTITTASNGIAVTSAFTTNNIPGSYKVTAKTNGVSAAMLSLQNLPIPSPLSPANIISDTTPTLQWVKVVGATKYQYQVWKDNILVYSNTITANICGATSCSITPTTALPYGDKYKWNVQAFMNGIWQGYSAYQSFSVIFHPLPGLWTGDSMEFYVAESRVNNFAIFIKVNGCGSYKLTYTIPTSIIKSKFSFTGSFLANGTFDNTGSAHGQMQLKQYYIKGCGFISGGPFDWTAVFKSLSQPAFTLDSENTPFIIQPAPNGVSLFDDFDVERIGP